MLLISLFIFVLVCAIFSSYNETVKYFHYCFLLTIKVYYCSYEVSTWQHNYYRFILRKNDFEAFYRKHFRCVDIEIKSAM